MEIRPSRRRFLQGVGLSTAAATVGYLALPELLRAAGAQEQKLGADDLAAFTETVELAAASFYGTLRPHLNRPAAVSAAAAFGKQHADAANALVGLAGSKRVGTPNISLIPTLDDALHEAKNENDALKVAFDLENSIASTYLFLIDSAGDSAALLKTAVTVLPVAAQRAVVLGGLIGKSAKDLTAPDVKQAGFESEDKHVDPSAFPPVATTTTAAPAGKKA